MESKTFVGSSTNSLQRVAKAIEEALLSIIEKLNVKPDRTLTTGEAAVLRFVRSVDAGTKGRGASDCQVRNDNKVAVTAWYDKKLVLMASNEFSIDDEDICQRWSKATNTHVGVKRPRVVREYNSAMGGVDVHDQIVSYYRSPNRTKKWTVRVVLHVLDVVTANCWLEYRKDMESNPNNI
nr:uncharacterized protein LOC113827765 [Penaeus vannamei]